MQKIEFPRVGVDGNFYAKEKIEKWYLKELDIKEIKKSLLRYLKKLQKLTGSDYQQRCLKLIIRYLKEIIFLSPIKMKKIIEKIDAKYENIFEYKEPNSKSNFKDKLLYKLGYKDIRSTILVSLSKRINYKTCAYCNSQFSLYVDLGKDKKALFQYDHFFSKSKYPFLSISLYNLIPVCASCNHSKRGNNLDLIFNPYHSNISDLFKFKIGKGLFEIASSIQGEFSAEMDSVDSTNQGLIDEFDKAFHISSSCSRHRDIAEELYYKSYLLNYYKDDSNFSFLPEGFDKMRILLGTYTQKDEIGKRPLTKFIQDIWQEISSYQEIP